MRFWLPIAYAIGLALGAATAQAGSVTGTVTITVQPQLAIVFTPPTPTIPCNAASGTAVTALSTTGGDGNAVTFAATGGDTGDFTVTGSNLVVGPSGIATAHCPATGQTTSENVTVTATQP